MKPRKLIATLAAGAAFAGHALPPVRPSISFNQAIEIAQEEMTRRGLADIYHIFAFYAGADRQSKGAAFTAIVRPHSSAGSVAKRASVPPRLKLLIHEDGHTTLQPIPPRARSA